MTVGSRRRTPARFARAPWHIDNAFDFPVIAVHRNSSDFASSRLPDTLFPLPEHSCHHSVPIRPESDDAPRRS